MYTFAQIVESKRAGFRVTTECFFFKITKRMLVKVGNLHLH
jgi:hypothetical protein